MVDDLGLRLISDTVCQPLDGFDLLFVPGGLWTRSRQSDPEFVQWLKTGAPVPLKVSVCTGALLLGAAGFLHGRRATTHSSATAELAACGAEVVRLRVVDDGDIVTAGGVASAIDAGLYIVERLAGPAARSRIAAQMDYPYRWDASRRETPKSGDA